MAELEILPKVVPGREDASIIHNQHLNSRVQPITREHLGEIFLERCRIVLAELEAAEAELANTTAAPRGRLRVGVPVASDLLTPLLGEFMQRYPEIALDLDYNDRLVDVIDDGFDAVDPLGRG